MTNNLQKCILLNKILQLGDKKEKKVKKTEINYIQILIL